MVDYFCLCIHVGTCPNVLLKKKFIKLLLHHVESMPYVCICFVVIPLYPSFYYLVIQ